MNYKTMVAFAAASILLSTQPGMASGVARGHHNHLQTINHGEGLELGDFSAYCCGYNDTASSQTLHIPGQGFAVRLTANGGSYYAETGVENLDSNPTYVKKAITFNLTSNGNIPSFIVYVFYTLNGGSVVERDLTVANGGLLVNGSVVTIPTTGAHAQIPTGARITGLYFDLEQDCGSVSSGSEIANISNVFIDNAFVNYELDHGVLENEGASCIGGGC